VGLKVTVRCGLGGTDLSAAEVWDKEDIKGVVSFELDAMVGGLRCVIGQLVLEEQ